MDDRRGVRAALRIITGDGRWDGMLYVRHVWQVVRARRIHEDGKEYYIVYRLVLANHQFSGLASRAGD
jgi:hypothetical protein